MHQTRGPTKPAIAGPRTGRRAGGAVGLPTRLYTAGFAAVGFLYLLWRTTIVGSGWLLALSVPLLWAETWAWLQIVCLRHQVNPGRQLSRLEADKALPHDSPTDAVNFDAVISTDKRTTSTDLERTMVGLAAMNYDGSVTVLTNEAADHLQPGLADEALNVTYVAAPGVVGDPLALVLDRSTAAWVLWLEAGQVPMPDLIEAIGQQTQQERMAVCQFANGLLNPESMAHLHRSGDEEALEHQAIGAGLAARGRAPWHGPGSLIRRRAIEQTQLQDSSIATVSQQSVALVSSGWTINYESKALIRVPAADSLRPYLSRRRDRSLAVLEQLGYAFTLPGVPWSVRRTMMARAISVTHGLRQLGMVAILIASLMAGTLPVSNGSGPVLALMAGYAGLAMLARRSLSGGAMGVGDWVRHGWRTVGADCAALLPRLSKPATASRIHQLVGGDRGLSGRLRLPTAAFTGLQVALAVRAVTVVRPALLPDMTRSDSAVLIVLATMATVQLIDVLGGLTRTGGRRRSPRIPLKSDISLGAFWGQTVDVSPLGVGAIVDAAPPIGQPADLTFAIGGTENSEHVVRAVGVVRSAARHRTGLVRVGIEFQNMDDEHRLALTKYCALGVTEPAHGQPTTIEKPETLPTERSKGDLALVRALAVASVMSATAALFVGPAADPVVAADNGATAIPETISVTGVETLGEVVLRTHTDDWSDPWTSANESPNIFDRPTGTATWPGPVHVEVSIGDDRVVMAADDAAAGIKLATLSMADDVASVELVGPGGSVTAGQDGQLLIPGHYTVRIGAAGGTETPTVTKIEVGQGSSLRVNADGAVTQGEAP